MANGCPCLRLLLVAASVGCLPALGCGYVQNRRDDLLDCGQLCMGISVGIGLEVKATGLLHPAIGLLSAGRKYGWGGRNALGAWPEKESFFPYSAQEAIGTDKGIGRLRRDNPLSGIVPIFFRRRGRNVESCSRLFWSPAGICLGESGAPPHWCVLSTLGDIEVGVTAGYISARVGLNLMEIIDLVIGFTTLDIAGDDQQGGPTRMMAI